MAFESAYHYFRTWEDKVTNSTLQAIEPLDRLVQSALRLPLAHLETVNANPKVLELLLARTARENTSLLLALGIFAFLLIRTMSSWARFGESLGRFSPFSRSPTYPPGPTKVTDADFSYITPEDLRREDAEHGTERATDIIVFKSKDKEIHHHFGAHSISRGEITIARLREKAAERYGVGDPSQVKLVYRGKSLKDDSRTCNDEDLMNMSEIKVVFKDAFGFDNGSDTDEDAADGHGEPKKRRYGRKKSKRRDNKREPSASERLAPDHDHRGVSSSSAAGAGRVPFPRPTNTPQGSLEKMDALATSLRGYAAEVDEFKRQPPSDHGKQDFEQKRLNETILTQILLKLDAVDVEGDLDARARRKELVHDAQGIMSDLDAFMKR